MNFQGAKSFGVWEVLVIYQFEWDSGNLFPNCILVIPVKFSRIVLQQSEIGCIACRIAVLTFPPNISSNIFHIEFREKLHALARAIKEYYFVYAHVEIPELNRPPGDVE